MERWKDKKIDGMDSKKLVSNASAYTILGLALLAMTFFGVCDPSSGMRGPKGHAARVDGEVISAGEFRSSYQRLYEQMQSRYGEEFEKQNIRIAAQVMDQLVNERIIYLTATQNGFRASDEEVMSQLVEAKAFLDEKGQFSEEGFKRYLRSNQLSEANFLEMQRRYMTVQKFRQFLGESSYASSKMAELEYKLAETKINLSYLKIASNQIKVNVSAKEVTDFLAAEDNLKKAQEYFDANKSEYDREKEVKARHILIQFKDARNATATSQKRTKKQAREKANSVLKEVKANPTKFADLAKKHTDEAAGKTKGGDLGFFKKQTMVKEFSEVAFGMKKGAVSGLVESPFGFHIIKVEDIKEPVKKEFAQVKSEIAKNLLEKEKKPKVLIEKVNQLTDFLSKKNDAAADKLMKELGTVWQETGDFAVNARYIPGVGSLNDDLLNTLLTLDSKDKLSEPVEVFGNKFILKVKNIKDADVKSLTEDRRKSLARNQGYTRAFALFQNLEKEAQARFKNDGLIEKNASYLELDDQRRQ